SPAAPVFLALPLLHDALPIFVDLTDAVPELVRVPAEDVADVGGDRLDVLEDAHELGTAELGRLGDVLDGLVDALLVGLDGAVDRGDRLVHAAQLCLYPVFTSIPHER